MIDCPLCCSSFGSTWGVAHHLWTMHVWSSCPCGRWAVGHSTPAHIITTVDAIRYLAAHIEAVGDFGAHVAEAELLRAARERRGDA